MGDVESVLKSYEKSKANFFEELKELVRIPSVSFEDCCRILKSLPGRHPTSGAAPRG